MHRKREFVISVATFLGSMTFGCCWLNQPAAADPTPHPHWDVQEDYILDDDDDWDSIWNEINWDFDSSVYFGTNPWHIGADVRHFVGALVLHPKSWGSPDETLSWKDPLNWSDTVVYVTRILKVFDVVSGQYVKVKIIEADGRRIDVPFDRFMDLGPTERDISISVPVGPHIVGLGTHVKYEPSIDGGRTVALDQNSRLKLLTVSDDATVIQQAGTTLVIEEDLIINNAQVTVREAQIYGTVRGNGVLNVAGALVLGTAGQSIAVSGSINLTGGTLVQAADSIAFGGADAVGGTGTLNIVLDQTLHNDERGDSWTLVGSVLANGGYAASNGAKLIAAGLTIDPAGKIDVQSGAVLELIRNVGIVNEGLIVARGEGTVIRSEAPVGWESFGTVLLDGSGRVEVRDGALLELNCKNEAFPFGPCGRSVRAVINNDVDIIGPTSRLRSHNYYLGCGEAPVNEIYGYLRSDGIVELDGGPLTVHGEMYSTRKIDIHGATLTINNDFQNFGETYVTDGSLVVDGGTMQGVGVFFLDNGSVRATAGGSYTAHGTGTLNLALQGTVRSDEADDVLILGGTVLPGAAYEASNGARFLLAALTNQGQIEAHDGGVVELTRNVGIANEGLIVGRGAGTVLRTEAPVGYDQAGTVTLAGDGEVRVENGALLELNGKSQYWPWHGYYALHARLDNHVHVGTGARLWSRVYIAEGGTIPAHEIYGALLNEGTVDVDHALILHGPVTNSGQINVNAGLSFRGLLTNSGTIEVGSGSIQVARNALNSGLIALSNSPGNLTVDTDYQQMAAGVLDIEIGSRGPFSFLGQLAVTGNATLGGTLSITATESLDSLGDQALTIITAEDGVIGRFANEPDPGDHLGHGAFHRSLDYGATAVELGAFQAIAGDANGDGMFGFGDLVKMFTESGQYYGAGDVSDREWINGDFTGDGSFTFEDLIEAFEKAGPYYGRGVYPTSGLEAPAGDPAAQVTAAVPEPGGLVLMGTAVVGLAACAWRRRRKRGI